MKKYILLTIIGAFGLIGCNDFLDRDPLSDMSPSTFFGSKGDMRTWNAGIYDAMQKTLNRAHIDWGDLRSDNYTTTGYEDSQVYMNALESTKEEYSWKDLYACITRCNTAIERYPTIPGIIESDYANYIGQAHGMRALMYFYAIRVWGRVPLVTAQWDGDVVKAQVTRSEIEVVKKQIMDDIIKAEAYLVNTSDKFYINYATCKALKTDVHMWFKEYKEALEASEYFENNSNFELVKNEGEWKQMFLVPNSSREAIFVMAWNFDADGGSLWPQRVGASNTNNGYKISQTLFQEFVDRRYSNQGTDGRLWNVLDTVKLYSNNSRMPISYNSYYAVGIEKNTKYSDVDPNREYDSKNSVYKSHWLVLSTTSAAVQPQIYRLADVLLLRAEALNQLGRGNEALEIVNKIRKRVGYLADAKKEVSATSNKEEVETVILLERQLEFMAEGKRWFDLVRTNRVIPVMDKVIKERQSAIGIAPTGFGDEGRILAPIYYREFEANPALKGDQNKPYSEG